MAVELPEIPDWSAEPSPRILARFQVTKDGEDIETIELSEKKVTIFGRDDKCDVVCENETLSRLHAMVLHGKSGNVYVVDLGSRHGTFLDNQRLKPHERYLLRNGARIRFAASERVYRTVVRRRQPKPDASSSEPALKKQKVTQVRVRHILIKHRDSRRPSSWLEKRVTRSKEEAREALTAIREQLVQDGARFDEIARKRSHCNSAHRGGDLGFFQRGQMQPAFEEASFALAVGEISGIVDTASGLHIIERIA